MWKKLAVGSLACLTLATSAMAAETDGLLRSGRILKMTNGDIMCYLEVRDAKGNVRTIGADFEVCSQQQLINRKVRFTYKRMQVSDCESAEPCGKTRWEMLVSAVKPMKRK
jgi:hypothetical protein